MKVSCPTCDSKYAIADDKVVGRKVKVRCKSCGGQILVDGTLPMPDASASGAGSSSDDDDATRVFTSDERTAFDEAHAGTDEALTTAGPASVQGTAGANAPAQPAGELVWSVNVSETDERSLTTPQLVDAYLAGELEGEVYVWHDGLSDWSLIADVPELMAAIEAKRPKAAKAQPAPSAPVQEPIGKTPSPAAAGPKKVAPIALGKAADALKAKTTATKELSGAGGDGKDKLPGAEKKAAARLATAKRPESAHDLFAAAGKKGERDEIDVRESDSPEEQKLGARNESSVLFSLDALKAGITAPQASSPKAAPGRKGAPPAPKKKLEDLMAGASPAPLIPGIGGSPLLSSNQSLLTAPAPPPPKPEPVAVPVVAAAAAPAVPAVTAQPAQAKKVKLIAIAAAAAVVVIGGGLAIALSGGSDEGKATVASASAEPKASAKPQEAVKVAEPEKPAQPAATAEPTQAVASASAAASASATPSTSTAAVAVASTGTSAAGKTATATGATKAAETKTETKTETTKKESTSAAAAAGTGSFSRDAAVQALNVAASQASVCKKPDGPTGSGKVQITFAPSGRVTTAVVMGPPFAGTAVGGCVSGVFKRARVPAFAGDSVTVAKSFKIIP